MLAVISAWGACTCGSGGSGSMPQSVEDCMDEASLYYDAYTPEWNELVDKCVRALCEAEIIDCD